MTLVHDGRSRRRPAVETYARALLDGETLESAVDLAMCHAQNVEEAFVFWLLGVCPLLDGAHPDEIATDQVVLRASGKRVRGAGV